MLDDTIGTEDLPELSGMGDYIRLKDSLTKYTNVRAKDDFLTFVKMFAPTLVSDFEMGRHIELLCEKLQGVVDGNVKRLMVFLPPPGS